MSWMSKFRNQFATTFAISSLIVLAVGCHPLNGRWRGANSAIESGADDDWAPPKTSGYAQPKQYMRPTKQVGVSENSTSRTNKAIQPAEYQKPVAEVDTEQTTAKSKIVANVRDENLNSKTPPAIVETDDQSIDVDGAIAALPPNLQEVARRQLAAIENSQAEHGRQSNTLVADAKPSVPQKSSAKLSDTVAQGKQEAPVLEDAKARSSISAKLTDQLGSEVALASNQSEASSQEGSAESDPTVVPAVTSTKTSPADVVLASASNQNMAAVATKLEPQRENLHWGPSIQEAISKLEKSLENQPPQDEAIRLSQELTLRWLHLANRDLNEAMRPIEGLEEHEQNYFRYQAQALYEAGNPDASPSRIRRWSMVMNSQRQATNHLAAASNLEVRSLAFCTDVQGYGVLTKFPNYQFKPDQEILLYCELDNVFAEQVKAGYETQLQGTYEIIDPNGRRVADQLLPMEREICQNHRRDYFIIYHIFMPMQIAPGNYQMRVTIEDMKARKFGQSTLDFQIQK